MLGAARHIAGFGSDSDGHLYITSLDGGVWRVTGTGAADKPPVASFTLSRTTPAVGANVHLDASGSTDPDGPIISYSWDVDGDGKADGKGVTFDVSYPTAGARPITLTVGDAAGARSSRTQAVFVGGKGAAGAGGAGTLTAKLSVPGKQKLKTVRKRGLLVRFRSNTSATWRVTATMRKVARVGAAQLRTAHGRLARKTFRRTRATARCACGSRRTPQGHANGRHPRAGSRAGQRRDGEELGAGARRRLSERARPRARG